MLVAVIFALWGTAVINDANTRFSVNISGACRKMCIRRFIIPGHRERVKVVSNPKKKGSPLGCTRFEHDLLEESGSLCVVSTSNTKGFCGYAPASRI